MTSRVLGDPAGIDRSAGVNVSQLRSTCREWNLQSKYDLPAHKGCDRLASFCNIKSLNGLSEVVQSSLLCIGDTSLGSQIDRVCAEAKPGKIVHFTQRIVPWV